jgi:hypothetical protein
MVSPTAASRLQGVMLISILFAETAVLALTPQELEAREQELTALLQARLQVRTATDHSQTVNNIHQSSDNGVKDDEDTTMTTTLAVISDSYFNDAAKILNAAAATTPTPIVVVQNQPSVAPNATVYQELLAAVAQPVNTKMGAAVLQKLSGPPTNAPPTQTSISQQFIAQCPMVMFGTNVQVGGQTCGSPFGRWSDPATVNPNRTIMRWQPSASGNLYFGIDSAMNGEGSALYADMKQDLSFTGYFFRMKNCLNVERWQIEEEVYKVDSMGNVQSTLLPHDVTMNAAHYFLKYVIRNATGGVTAKSSLFKLDQNEIVFTEFIDGVPQANKTLAVVRKIGSWTGAEWTNCMAPSSQHVWDIYFPTEDNHTTPATVQDIRVAIAGAITLMGYRDQTRQANGVSKEGVGGQWLTMIVGLMLVICCCLCPLYNFYTVFTKSGLQQKLKKVMFESEGTIFPKRPYNRHHPPLHPTY